MPAEPRVRHLRGASLIRFAHRGRIAIIIDLPTPHAIRADAEFPVSGDAIARLRDKNEYQSPDFLWAAAG